MSYFSKTKLTKKDFEGVIFKKGEFFLAIENDDFIEKFFDKVNGEDYERGFLLNNYNIQVEPIPDKIDKDKITYIFRPVGTIDPTFIERFIKDFDIKTDVDVKVEETKTTKSKND